MEERINTLFKKYDSGYRTTTNKSGEHEWWSSNSVIWFHISPTDNRAYLSVGIAGPDTIWPAIRIDQREYELTEKDLEEGAQLLELYLKHLHDLYVFRCFKKFLMWTRWEYIPLLKDNDNYYEITDGQIEILDHLQPYTVKSPLQLKKV